MIAQMQETSMDNDAAWHPQADMVLSALEAASWAGERRQHARATYRARATLKFFADGANQPEHVLYTRDFNHRGIGFVTLDRLPLGYGGILRLPNPREPEKTLSIQCTLFRCRQAVGEWYEGALQFNRDQVELLVEGGDGVGEE
jgi:hypothetical protein